MYDFLRKIPLFADLPEEDLSRLCEGVEVVRLPKGELLFVEGSRGDRAYVIESGELEISKASGNRSVLLAIRHSGSVIGEMALLQDIPRTATVRAASDSVLYAIDQAQFNRLIDTSPTASRVMLHTVISRYRHMAAALRQGEKMAQLGTLTAGVAHELNNPAAAVKRGVAQLQEALPALVATQGRIAQLALTKEQRSALDERAHQAQESAGQPAPYLDALARSDREFELESWLDEQGVPDPWELAPTLVSLGYDLESLASFAAQFTPEQLPLMIAWLGAIYNVHDLLAEIAQGAGRISEIVKALKSYTYLDQAPVQSVDIHEGLDNTLLILRNKLARIKVRREYDPDLPQIEGYGSELNQVWTNLIDNAADALEDTPDAEIVIGTSHDDNWVTVEVRDNGPGIPVDVQSRLFDAFFTTKPPGKGTGLGLDISYKIVVDKHRGDIKVFSRPGYTRFQVILPLNFQAAGDQPRPIAAVSRLSDEQLRSILETYRNIAVVGISSRPERPGHSVPAYLQAHGYQIIPVNPNLEEVLGKKAYPDLPSVPESVDIVQIFRRSDEVLPVVEQAIQIGAKVIWMQEGVVDERAAVLARQAGLEVVMDACMRATHQRLTRADSRRRGDPLQKGDY